MIEIKNLLLGLDKILIKEELKKVLICEVINESIAVKLTPKDIQIKNNIVFLNLKPIYKNELYLKKELIDQKLVAALGVKAPRKIK